MSRPSVGREDVEVDARGLRCPLPVLRLAAAARPAAAGTHITLLATDPAARADIAAWCRMRGHTLVEIRHVRAHPDDAEETDQTEEEGLGRDGRVPGGAYSVYLVELAKPSGSGSGSAAASRDR